MRNLRLSVVLTLLLCGLAEPSEPDHDPGPLMTPGEFHQMEAERIARTLQAFSQSPLTDVQDDFDAVYYDLDLDIRDFYGETITGAVTILARVVTAGFNEMILDLCTAFTIDSVIADGAPAAYSQGSNLLTVTLNQAYNIDDLVEVTVYYFGTPCQTSSFTSFSYLNRSAPGGNVPTIATLSEPYGARDWWPSKNLPSDKADSARISITVADTIVATSNGTLESLVPVLPSSRKYTWFESHPIATYLISIAATNYSEWTDWYVGLAGDSMPIVNYTYPERLSQSLISWDVIPEGLTSLAGLFGEYPFIDEKYGHTMFNFGGAMEHQCNTSYGSGITNGGHYYDWIVIHEIGHQWWGDEVTLHTWPDIWLNEGFASYCEALWTEDQEGFQAYKNYMASGLSVFDPSGPVYNPNTLFDGNTVYDKGGWILHMLRGVIRDDSLFFAALREYRARHQDATATTAQFLSDVSDVVGYDVTPYLYVYLYLTNRPHFDVSYGSGMVDGVTRTAIRIEQTQTDPDTTFRTRLDLAFTGPSDSTTRVENSEWIQLYLLDLGFAPTGLSVDPDVWVLKSVNSVGLKPAILNTELTDGLELSVYDDTLIAIGGSPAYNWSILSGVLPDGVVLSNEGVLSGAPTEYGLFTIEFEVEDQLTDVDTKTLDLFVQGLPRVPEELTCQFSDPDSVTLRWKTAENADLYEVHRATLGDMSDASLIATIPDTTFTDAIPSDTTDVYRFYQVYSILSP